MNHDEFERIFEDHRNAVYQFVWRMTNSRTAAEDIAQEVFVALLGGETTYDPARGSIRALLLGVARHLIFKHWRRDRRWSSIDDDTFVAAPVTVATAGTEDIVSAAIAELPPLQREALILATYEELSLHQIADALLVEVGTVKSRLHRARENLKRMLAGYRQEKVRGQHGTAQ